MSVVKWGGVAAAALLGLAAASALADPLKQTDAMLWLEKVAGAARQVNFAGVFVYQHGGVVETSRIVHLVDSSGEHEKLETLDGPKREVIRTNDEVLTFFPETKTVRVERRKPRRSFPALLPDQLHAITDYYDVRKAEQERIAGVDTQALVLTPKDRLRYGHKFWAEVGSGLLVKAKMLNDSNHVIEQFAFTQLTINPSISKDDVRPSFDAAAASWRKDGFWSSEADPTDSAWEFVGPPAGFRKVMEMLRSREGSAEPALTHIVLSDGLAAVSVFIERAGDKQKVHEGASTRGSINIYTRLVGDQRVTVLGEAPADTVMKVAKSISRRPR
jgi:sigma-E factor negative regulatory protein RseB